MNNAADNHLDVLFRSALADRAETFATEAADENEMLTRLTHALARRRTRRMAALLLAAALVLGLTGAIAFGSRSPQPQLVFDRSPSPEVSVPLPTVRPTPGPSFGEPLLRRPGRQIGLDYVIPDGVTFDVHDESSGTVGNGLIAFTEGGPGPYGYVETRTSSRFVSGARGVVIADVTGAVVLHGEADPELRDDPAGFLADLGAKSVFLVEAVRETQLGELAAHAAFVTLDRHWYSHLDFPDHGGSVDFAHPSFVLVTQVEDALLLVQVWAETREELEAWLPTAMQFVDSVRFTHYNGVPLPPA